MNVAFENFLISIDKQYKNFRDFSLLLKENDSRNNYFLNYATGFHLNNISIVSRNDFFKAFAIEQNGSLEAKSQAFASLFNVIELLTSIIDSQKEDLKAFIDTHNKHQFEIDDAVSKIDKKFKREVLKLAAEGSSQFKPGSIHEKVDLIISEWQTHPDYLNVYVKKEMIFDKLIPILRERRVSDFRFELEEIALSGLLSFMNFEQNQKQSLVMYKSYTLLLARSRLKIKKELVFFNSLKPKKILWLFPFETKELIFYKNKWYSN